MSSSLLLTGCFNQEFHPAIIDDGSGTKTIYEWWRADAGYMFTDTAGTILVNTSIEGSERIARWNGSFTGAPFLQASTSERPIYESVGGIGSILFDGADDYMDAVAACAACCQNQAAFTIASVVFLPDTSEAAQHGVYISRNAANSVRMNQSYNTGGFHICQSRRQDADSSYSYSDDGAYNSDEWVVRIDTINYVTGKVNIYVNGTAVAAEGTASWTAGGNTSNTASSEVLLSRATLPFSGAFKDVLMYRAALSQAQVTQLTTYLRQLRNI